MLMDIIREYYGVIIVAVCAVVYGVTHREIAIANAKQAALRFIFMAEAKAEELLLANGPAKKQWVLEHGYEYLPQAVKYIVTPKLFETLVQQAFDAAMAYVQNHRLEQ